MGMVLNKKRSINGVSSKHAVSISKLCYQYPKTASDLARVLEVTETTMMHWLVCLDEIGILNITVEDGVILWHCTPYGFTNLVHARIGQPITGTQFVKLVLEVTRRAYAYNKEERFPYLIDEISLLVQSLVSPGDSMIPI